jgi:hypothetical protein
MGTSTVESLCKRLRSGLAVARLDWDRESRQSRVRRNRPDPDSRELQLLRGLLEDAGYTGQPPATVAQAERLLRRLKDA